MSVINQMLKDLEHRRAHSFDNEGSILDDLATGGLGSGRNRGVKLILLLLIVVVVLLAWLLWDRFMQAPEQVINVAKQEAILESQATANKPLVNRKPVNLPESAPVKVVVQAESPDIETEQVEVIGEATAVSAEPEVQKQIISDSDKTQERLKDSRQAAGDMLAHIERIAPTQFVATGERTVMRVYGEGFIPPFEVLLEWADGRDSKVLEDRQVELINESEMRLHFNPGTQADEWSVRVGRRDGTSSERFAFKVHALDEEIQQATSAVTVKPKQQSSPSKTRLKVAPAEQATNLFAKASGLLKSGQSSEAVKVLYKVISLDSGHNRARELLASLLFQNQEYAEATDVLEAGIAQDSGHIPFKLLLARVHMEQGRDTDAILVLESQKPLARDYSDYYALAAALYQRTGRHADAARVYRGLVEVFPGRAVWWMGLGISLQSLNKSEAALAAYKRASRAQGLQPELRDFVQKRIRLLGG